VVLRDADMKPLKTGDLFVSMPIVDISSSRIRRMIKNGCSIRYLVPDEAASYIAKKRLYRKSN